MVNIVVEVSFLFLVFIYQNTTASLKLTTTMAKKMKYSRFNSKKLFYKIITKNDHLPVPVFIIILMVGRVHKKNAFTGSSSNFRENSCHHVC